MASNFSSLRNARKNSLETLNKQIKDESSKVAQDERFWKLTVDPKTKVGYARIRFLMPPKGEDLSWVRLFTHGFQLNGWFIENCPTTFGQQACPVCKDNNRLWNSGVESDKAIARDRKRKQVFISNILVLEDPAHPENNGKNFLFKYGPKIHEKIQELINPQFPDQKAMNPFDFWEGADFKLKSALVKGYQNYDKSEFSDAAPLAYGKGKDADYEELWEKEYSLNAFVAPDQFKTYEELEKRFLKVLHGNDAPKTAEEAMKSGTEGTSTDAAAAAREVAKSEKASPAPKRQAPVTVVEDEEPSGDDADDIKNFFAGVLNN